MSHHHLASFKTSIITIAFLIVFLVQTCLAELVLRKGAPHVKCESGVYVGAVRTARGSQSYYEFLGIRYANPPTRFQPSELYTAPSGSERQNVITRGSKCPQRVGGLRDGEIEGEEDCLFLNIFVPMKTSPNKEGFPVMMWIHGGGFRFGSGDLYEPNYFMDQDVILVTINYRFGAFGFLSTGDEVVPGNMGLKDQVIALKWIQQNIKDFGGNKKMVTIFGHSAGSASVHYLVLSQTTKGLFHSAIAQSGSAYSLWAFSPKPKDQSNELGELLGCNGKDSNTLVECLQQKTMSEIITASTKMIKWNRDPTVVFAPTLESDNGPDSFLSDYPQDIVARRGFNRVPLMIGFTKDEGLGLHAAYIIEDEKLRNEMNTNWDLIAPITFNYKNWFRPDQLHTVSREIRDFYFGDKEISSQTLDNLANLYTDANFMYGVSRFALEHASENPVYPYIFTFHDPSSSQTLLKLKTKERKPVVHGDELQYLFKTDIFEKSETLKDSEAEIFSKMLVRLWASFATHRKPTELWGPAMKWPPISKAQIQGEQPYKWYRLDKATEVLNNPMVARKKFWEQIFKKYLDPQAVKDEL